MTALFMVFESPGVRGEAIDALFQKYLCFWKLEGNVVNSLLMFWNLEEVVVKPFEHLYKEILMKCENSGRCCEFTTDGFEFPGSCCEGTYAVLQEHINDLEFPGGCCEAIYTN